MKYIEYVLIIDIEPSNLKGLELRTHNLQILTPHLLPWTKKPRTKEQCVGISVRFLSWTREKEIKLDRKEK